MAKRFRFSLETLLRVRELHEREAKRKLGAKLAEIARIDQLNQQAATEISETQAAMLDDQRHLRLDSRELVRRQAWIAHLRRTIALRRQERAERQSEAAQLREQLGQARTRKRIIEKLRERRFEEHRRDTRRAEQAASDELAQRLPTLNRATRSA